MTIIAIDSARYCQGPDVAQAVSDRLGHPILEDEAIFVAAAARFRIPSQKLRRSVYGPPGLLGIVRQDRDRNVACVRAALASLLAEGEDLVFQGLCGHLIPPAVTHALKVCLVGTRAYREDQAVRAGLSERQAQRAVERDEASHASWKEYLFEKSPWDKDLFDLFIPVHEVSAEGAVDRICQSVESPAVATTPESRAALADFSLASEVQIVLVQKGHDVDVTARGGSVEILMQKHSLFPDRLKRELEALARGVPGVREVTAQPGPKYRAPNIYVNLDADLPSRVLLVDDEKEFVETLSERLQTRNIASQVAYDGDEALAKIEEEEPEVMVLDLKMPGIDGLEVLRRVKAKHPETEVIILTGHGSDAEKTVAQQLGAFAYLRKPVDTDALAQIMQQAYQKVAASKGRGDHG